MVQKHSEPVVILLRIFVAWILHEN